MWSLGSEGQPRQRRGVRRCLALPGRSLSLEGLGDGQVEASLLAPEERQIDNRQQWEGLVSGEKERYTSTMWKESFIQHLHPGEVSGRICPAPAGRW